jgi:antitoxin component YwqK of YwqJK toxin-antitoxin module
MKILNQLAFALVITILSSCGNNVEEIKNEVTGKLTKRYEYYLDDSGQKIMDGEYTEWDDAGLISTNGKYEKDLRVGSWILNKANGDVYKMNYTNGLLQGKVNLFSAYGTVLDEANYKDGVLHGKQKYYSAAGNLERETYYTQGKQNGIATYFDEKQKVKFKLKFVSNICQEFIGEWKILGEESSSMVFGADGNFHYMMPYFRFGEAKKQYPGTFEVTDSLVTFNQNHAKLLIYSIVSFDKSQMVFMHEGENGKTKTVLRKL